jgi:hypothetical protein
VRLETFLALFRLDENETGGRAVGAGRAQFQHIDEVVQEVVGHVLLLPLVVGAGVKKNLAERVFIDFLRKRGLPAPTLSHGHVPSFY